MTWANDPPTCTFCDLVDMNDWTQLTVLVL
jgi:hypothetical protein